MILAWLAACAGCQRDDDDDLLEDSGCEPLPCNCAPGVECQACDVCRSTDEAELALIGNMGEPGRGLVDLTMAASSSDASTHEVVAVFSANWGDLRYSGLFCWLSTEGSGVQDLEGSRERCLTYHHYGGSNFDAALSPTGHDGDPSSIAFSHQEDSRTGEQHGEVLVIPVHSEAPDSSEAWEAAESVWTGTDEVTIDGSIVASAFDPSTGESTVLIAVSIDGDSELRAIPAEAPDIDSFSYAVTSGHFRSGADLTGDGIDDVVFWSESGYRVEVGPLTGGVAEADDAWGTFESGRNAEPLGYLSSLPDFDGDGYSDVYCVSAGSFRATLFSFGGVPPTGVVDPSFELQYRSEVGLTGDSAPLSGLTSYGEAILQSAPENYEWPKGKAAPGGAHLIVPPLSGAHDLLTWDGESLLGAILIETSAGGVGAQTGALVTAFDLDGDGADDPILANDIPGETRIFFFSNFSL